MHAFHADINKRLSIVSAPSSMMGDALRKDSTMYVGAYEFCSNSSDKYFFANGYIDIEQGHAKAYCYYVKDHLGNVRHVDRAGLDNRGNEIVQVSNYYSYGGVHTDVDNGVDVQNHLYNGKELDRMHGLNLYDYSARQYDAAIGQFTSMDPLCEKYYHISPYAYCAGNPVKYVDPDGRDIWELNKDGNLVWIEKSDIHQLYALDKDGNRTTSITVKDRSILDGLAKDRKGTDANYVITKSAEAGKVFLFAAENSNVEWEIDKFADGNIITGTSHEEESVDILSSSGLKEDNMLLSIHSHWEDDGTKGGSGVDPQTGNYHRGGDMWNITYKSERFAKRGIPLPRYYVYHVKSKGLYEFRPTNPSIYKGELSNYNSLYKTLGGK